MHCWTTARRSMPATRMDAPTAWASSWPTTSAAMPDRMGAPATSGPTSITRSSICLYHLFTANAGECRMQEHITILLSGAPGTGKSTVQARAPYFFRARLGEAAALGTDQFYTLFDPRWTNDNRHWWKLALGSCACVTRYLFQQGVGVVLIASNGLYTSPDINTVLVELLPVSAVYHITLDAQLDTVV